MFPVSSIGNDISSDLVRRKMNDLPESPTGNNLEALAPGIEKLKQTSIEMVTLLNTLQPVENALSLVIFKRISVLTKCNYL
ncbi:hypothetical protein BANRA_03617 [Escherichia coli]|nr:hypothetical protein BANRA_03617 [Escherichia coli]